MLYFLSSPLQNRGTPRVKKNLNRHEEGGPTSCELGFSDDDEAGDAGDVRCSAAGFVGGATPPGVRPPRLFPPGVAIAGE
jgi:hypothetical protein